MANQEHITIRHAVDRYINAKSAVLSPSTVAGYIRYRNLYLQSIYDKYIDEITQEEFQIAVNKEVCLYSPKTLRNACGLVKSAISMFIERDFKITLPQRIRPSFYIPEKEEVKKIYEKIKGTELEIPFLLASQCGLRPSEIAALTTADIVHGNIEITKARVTGVYGDVVKTPKTYAGYRSIPISEELQLKIEENCSPDKKVTALTSKQISNRWRKFMDSKGFSYFKFYALRHYFASRALLLGIPQKYIAEMMGHSTLVMIESVYQHTFPSAMKKFKTTLCDSMNELIS